LLRKYTLFKVCDKGYWARDELRAGIKAFQVIPEH
jgi:hypothetical protein